MTPLSNESGVHIKSICLTSSLFGGTKLSYKNQVIVAKGRPVTAHQTIPLQRTRLSRYSAPDHPPETK